MGEVRVQTEIEAPPEAVWAVLADFGAWDAWNQVIVGGRCDGGQGARVSCKVAVGPIWFPVESRLKIWEEGKALAWGEERGRIVRIVHGFELEPTAAGTRFTHYERFEGAIGRLIFPAVNRPLTRTYTAFNQALARRVQ